MNERGIRARLQKRVHAIKAEVALRHQEILEDTAELAAWDDEQPDNVVTFKPDRVGRRTLLPTRQPQLA